MRSRSPISTARSLTVTLSVTNGTLSLGTLAGLTFTTGDGTADTTMTFSGSQAALNAALASLGFAPTADYNGAAALTFTTSDGVAPAVSKTVGAHRHARWPTSSTTR